MADLPPERDAKDDASTPRWVYVFGITAIVVVVLFVVLHLITGGLGYHLHTRDMMITPCVRKFALTAHVTSSVGCLGAVVGFLALAVAGLTSHDPQIVRASYLRMEWTAWFVIVPLSLPSPLTGLLQSLGTSWGCSGITGSWRNS